MHNSRDHLITTLIISERRDSWTPWTAGIYQYEMLKLNNNDQSKHLDWKFRRFKWGNRIKSNAINIQKPEVLDKENISLQTQEEELHFYLTSHESGGGGRTLLGCSFPQSSSNCSGVLGIPLPSLHIPTSRLAITRVTTSLTIIIITEDVSTYQTVR